MSLEHDVRELSQLRQASALPRLLARLAGQTAQVVNLGNVAQDVELPFATTEAYTRLLEAMFLIHQLPAWGTTLNSRSSAKPKVHIVDSGVGARLLRLSEARLSERTPTALTEFGHIFETFVVGEIVRQAHWLDDLASLGHWRSYERDEVDVVVENGSGQVVAFEVKANARVSTEHLRPLQRLRGLLGGSFLAGVCFYMGEHSYVADDRIVVLPADRLWT